MKYLRQMQVSRELFYFTNFPTIRKVTDKFKLFQKEYPFRQRRFLLAHFYNCWGWSYNTLIAFTVTIHPSGIQRKNVNLNIQPKQMLAN